MKTIISALIALVGLSLVAIDAEARRLSGGRNLGTQRSAPAQQQAAPKAPAQQQQAAPATPAQQPAGASKWLGPLAGLALGAGLAALFLNNGLAGLLSGILLIGLMVAALAFLARFLMRGKSVPAPLQYAGASASGPAVGPAVGHSVTTLPGSAGAHSVAATTGRWPAGFDADGFVRHARLNFVRLQDAYDKNDLTMMRDFLAPEVYREVEADIHAENDAPKKTEVLTLESEVLDVAEEAGSYIVSVRFSGLTREADGQPESFSEIWHLEKPVKGRAGWLVAGIQQV